MAYRSKRPRNNTARRSSSVSELLPIDLPRPTTGRSKSVLAALQQRRTVREFAGRKLTSQVLSNLLWAACGVNRKKVPIGINGRTAASASNSQEIDLYVALEDAAHLYDAPRHRLVPVVAADVRPFALGKGQPDVGAKAPVRLIYVVDIDKLVHTTGFKEPGLKDPETQKAYYYVDTGLMAANVYLFAASTGLATWFHNCDKTGLRTRLKLRPDQRVLFAQTVGYPA